MYIFLEQRTKDKPSSNTEVSVVSMAIQYDATRDSSEGTVFFHCVRHFRDCPLLENRKTSTFMNIGFFKKQFNRSRNCYTKES